ncbi:MAG: DUF4340 domain-containing protein [Deltaproteobacteria bacterium]|nr:DUF4340 domain-containing protein [Deltaproteobacteria bacterium]
MTKSLIGHAIVAAFAALLAFVAWTSPKPAKDDTVIAVPGSADKLDAVMWHDEGFDVTVRRDGDSVSVTTTKLGRPGKADPADDAGKADAPKPPAAPFPGSKEAEELFAKLLPLKAGRSLGKLDAGKLKPLGLEAPKSKLSLMVGGDTLVVEIGDAAYGTGDLYGRAADGEVFLIPAATLSSLRHGAVTLAERALLPVKDDKIERVTIAVGGAGREVTQRYPSERARAFYADPAEPEAKLELVNNWLSRALRLRIIEQVSETPQGAPAFEVEAFGAKGSLGNLKVYPPGDKVALATSSRFKSTVSIARPDVDALLKDADAAINEGK